MQAVCSAVRINGLIGYRIKLVHREMSSHLEAYKCKPRSVDPDLKMDTRCTSAPGGGGGRATSEHEECLPARRDELALHFRQRLYVHQGGKK